MLQGSEVIKGMIGGNYGSANFVEERAACDMNVSR